MKLPDAFVFASDAAWAGLAGTVCLIIAVIAGVAERRRHRRVRIDAVGWVPWTTVSFFALFGGVVLLAFAAKGLVVR